jgi:hypothetical protein
MYRSLSTPYQAVNHSLRNKTRTLGKHFAFLSTTPARVDLSVGDAATGKIHNGW